MSNSDFAATMYESDPMVAALNKVPGFDPLKLMDRKRIPGAEKDEKSLDFRYKKLWFRLAHRTGRIRLNRLSITEQLAIIEAQVYLELTDANPVSSFTAACTREEGGDKYIESAQIRAMDQALTDAGFGLQFVPAPVGSRENTAPQAAGPVANMQIPKAPQPVMQQVQQATGQQRVVQQAAPQQGIASQQAGVPKKAVAVQAVPQQATAPQPAVVQQKTAAAQAVPGQRTAVQQAGIPQKTVATQAAPRQGIASQQAGVPQRTVAVQPASQQAVAQQKTVAAQTMPQQRAVPQQKTVAVQSAVRQQAAAAQQSVVQQQTAVSQQRSVAQQAAVQPQAVRQYAAPQAAIPNKPAQTAHVQAQTVQAGQKRAAIPAQAGMQTAAVSPAAPAAPQKAAVPVSTQQAAAQQPISAETLLAGQHPVTAEAQELPVTSDIAAAMSLLSGKKEDTLPVAPAGMKAGEKAESMPQELPVAPTAAATGTPVVPAASTVAASGTSNTAAPTAPVSEMPAAPAPAANAGGAADEGRLYTEETPVEEILRFMTLEDAKKVVVSAGTCRGQTIAEVAQRRPFSLKFYLSEAYQGRDNILRAAARLMLDGLEKKAG